MLHSSSGRGLENKLCTERSQENNKNKTGVSQPLAIYNHANRPSEYQRWCQCAPARVEVRHGLIDTVEDNRVA